MQNSNGVSRNAVRALHLLLWVYSSWLFVYESQVLSEVTCNTQQPRGVLLTAGMKVYIYVMRLTSLIARQTSQGVCMDIFALTIRLLSIPSHLRRKVSRGEMTDARRPHCTSVRCIAYLGVSLTHITWPANGGRWWQIKQLLWNHRSSDKDLYPIDASGSHSSGLVRFSGSLKFFKSVFIILAIAYKKDFHLREKSMRRTTSVAFGNGVNLRKKCFKILVMREKAHQNTSHLKNSFNFLKK